jgi:hypothetical protein
MTASGCSGAAQADHIKDAMLPCQYTPQFLIFSQANSRPEMGIIVSCIAGIVACIGDCIMGIIGAIVDCLECIIAGTPYPLGFMPSLGTSDVRRAAITGLLTGIVDCICACLCCG